MRRFEELDVESRDDELVVVDNRSKLCGSCRPRTRRESRWFSLAAVLSLVVLILLIVVSTGGQQSGGNDQQKQDGQSGASDEICLTPTCVALASQLSQSVDLTVDPCDDFYQHVCGNWAMVNPRPADRSSYSNFDVLSKRNNALLRRIFDPKSGALDDEFDVAHISEAPSVVRPALELYDTCAADRSSDMSAGMSQMEARMSAIEVGADREHLQRELESLHSAGYGMIFASGVGVDDRDPLTHIMELDQGTLSLPLADYFGDEFQHKRELFVAHVEAVLGLLGFDNVNGTRVLELETALAELHMTRYWSVLTAQEVPYVLVRNTRLIERCVGVVTDFDTETVEAFLRWHVARPFLHYLSHEVRQEVNAFNEAFSGVSERPRSERCLALVDEQYPMLAGRLFVSRAFAGDSKATADTMIESIRETFREQLPEMSWLDDDTRHKADEKAHSVRPKIGHPDWLLDDAALAAEYVHKPFDESTALLATLTQFAQADARKNYDKAGTPVDRQHSFDMSPPTVNAYYDPSSNEIVFPAGILQPPFFHRDLPASFNAGGIGVVIGHELTHGFDDEGSQYDKDGRLHSWWTPESRAAFEQRAMCVNDQYSSFEYFAHGVNGTLTLGENIADNGGLGLSYKAWQSQAPAQHKLPLPAPLNSWTPEQLFFVAFANVWCGSINENNAIDRLTIDPHAPHRFRVIGTLQNSPEFAEAFQCAAGTRMNPQEKCKVW
ncbi:MAG: hypothetical protein MHM6MM_000851 [Cercozoa sp. M6MM]